MFSVVRQEHKPAQSTGGADLAAVAVVGVAAGGRSSHRVRPRPDLLRRLLLPEENQKEET